MTFWCYISNLNSEWRAIPCANPILLFHNNIVKPTDKSVVSFQTYANTDIIENCRNKNT